MASHNPKKDNVCKCLVLLQDAKWFVLVQILPLNKQTNKHSIILTGPQITPPHDTNILQSINQNLKPKEGQGSFSEDLSGFKENLRNPKDFVDGYYNTLKKMVYDESVNSKFDKKIVYSAMHGI